MKFETPKVYEKYTKYEVARILGARALQISMNAPLLLNIPEKRLEEVDFNPLKIAEIEFEADILPITVKRPLPQRAEFVEGEEEEDIEIEEEAAPKVAEEAAEAPEEKEEKTEATEPAE